MQEFIFTVIGDRVNMRARSNTAPGNFGLNQVLAVNPAVVLSSPEIAATSIGDSLETLLVYCWNKESQIVEIIGTLAGTTYSWKSTVLPDMPARTTPQINPKLGITRSGGVVSLLFTNDDGHICYRARGTDGRWAATRES